MSTKLPKLPDTLYARYQEDGDSPWINTNEEINQLIEEYGTEYNIGVYKLTHYVKAKSTVETVVSK